MIDYYKSIFGEISREASFNYPDGASLKIYKWSDTNEGVTMYTTDGASDVLIGESCEFFIGLSPESDSIVKALAEIALEGIDFKVPKYGDTITLAYPLWNGTEMRTMLFTEGEEIIPTITNEKKCINFIQLVPLFPSELEIKKKYGEERMWEVLEYNQIPFWDPTRENRNLKIP